MFGRRVFSFLSNVLTTSYKGEIDRKLDYDMLYFIVLKFANMSEVKHERK
ncbi:hypothetical protein KPL40_18480 [Clostridium gasigenes]|nr:hypothetical protein [Clostridium gasigenes]MBU3134404.1 hypothetical protein [Clostridium gasigenes]